jgi:Arylsulfatase A and related enzymes
VHHLVAGRHQGKGEVREQYHHAIDLVPTILDVLGVDAPETIKGHTQVPFDGVSMRSTFDDAKAPSTRSTQFYAMLGSRDLARWLEGRHESSDDCGVEQLQRRRMGAVPHRRRPFRAAQPRRRAPEKVRELVNLWYAEAGANGAFPLDDRSALEIMLTPRPVLSAPRDRYIYFPDARGSRVAGGQRA